MKVGRLGLRLRRRCGEDLRGLESPGPRGRLADGCAVDRRVSQGLVPAALVVVADELGEDRAEVSFAEDDQMVEALRGAVCHRIRESSDEFSHVLQGEGLLHKS